MSIKWSTRFPNEKGGARRHGLTPRLQVRNGITATAKIESTVAKKASERRKRAHKKRKSDAGHDYRCKCVERGVHSVTNSEKYAASARVHPRMQRICPTTGVAAPFHPYTASPCCKVYAPPDGPVSVATAHGPSPPVATTPPRTMVKKFITDFFPLRQTERKF